MLHSMDRPIDPAVARRLKIRRLSLPALVALVALGLLALTISWLRPSLSRDRVRTAVVERGEVTATLDASGLVVPQSEQVFAAPLATRIVRVLKTPGTQVAAGDTILLLDQQDAGRDVARLREQIALKANARKQTMLELARSRNDLSTRRDIKALELESAQFELERNRKMLERGLIIKDDVRKSETGVERATIELRQLDTLLANAQEDLETRVEGLALEIKILEKDLEVALERLRRTAVTSDRAGMITWVATQEGTAVASGEPVARVSDLTSYRVEATLSDVLARRLTVGLPAVVKTGDTLLAGRVQKILPTVQNGIVTFEVTLDVPNHPVLRPNLRVDVHAVTELRPQTLRLRRGPLLNVDGRDAVFVIRGDEAVRTPVTVGLSNFELYEITDGLAEGDEVIISDMTEYRNSEEVELK
jgi:HlyD family secretion protein